MRVLLVTHFFGEQYSTGTENYTLGVAQGLKSRGHEVQVLCAEDWQTGSAYWNGVTDGCYRGIPVRRIHLNWMKAGNPNRVLYDSLPAEQWLNQHLRQTRPDIVHVTSTYSLGVGVLRATNRAGVPLVLTLTDFWFLCPRTVLLRVNGDICSGAVSAWDCQECLLESSRWHRTAKRLVPAAVTRSLWGAVCRAPALARLRYARGIAIDIADRRDTLNRAIALPDVILAPSRFLQRLFAAAGLSDRVEYLPHGLDLSWMAGYAGKSPDTILRFGYIGQISPHKGVHTLIEAFRIAGLDGRAQLRAWGSLPNGEYVDGLKALIGDATAVVLAGHFGRDQLARVLADIDVLVVPSLWYENAPLAIQEAFATTTPVVAANLGGMAESVTDGVNGLLFIPGDPYDLAEKLRRLVDEPDLLSELQSGIRPVRTVREEMDELEAVYVELLASDVFRPATGIGGAGATEH